MTTATFNESVVSHVRTHSLEATAAHFDISLGLLHNVLCSVAATPRHAAVLSDVLIDVKGSSKITGRGSHLNASSYRKSPSVQGPTPTTRRKVLPC